MKEPVVAAFETVGPLSRVPSLHTDLGHSGAFAGLPHLPGRPLHLGVPAAQSWSSSLRDLHFTPISSLALKVIYRLFVPSPETLRRVTNGSLTFPAAPISPSHVGDPHETSITPPPPPQMLLLPSHCHLGKCIPTFHFSSPLNQESGINLDSSHLSTNPPVHPEDSPFGIDRESSQFHLLHDVTAPIRDTPDLSPPAPI